MALAINLANGIKPLVRNGIELESSTNFLPNVLSGVFA